MLVYNTHLLEEVQLYLDALYALHLGTTDTLIEVSLPAKQEALRIWKNKRADLLAKIKEGLSEYFEQKKALGETGNFYAIETKGKIVWKSKIVLDEIFEKIDWYNGRSHFEEKPKTGDTLRDAITAPPEGWIVPQGITAISFPEWKSFPVKEHEKQHNIYAKITGYQQFDPFLAAALYVYICGGLIAFVLLGKEFPLEVSFGFGFIYVLVFLKLIK